MCNCDRSISWKVEKGRLDEEEGQGRDRLGDRRIFRVISKSVCCCMAFQQYDNLYGFGRGLQRLSSDPLPRVLPSVVFNGSPHPSLSLSFCPLFSLTPYSFLLSFPRTGRALRRPLTRTTRIALPGISEVLSRIQRLHRPSWMDRQSSLTLRLSAPPPSLSLFLPTLTPLLACSRFSLSLSLSAAAVVVVSSPARSFSSESIQPLDARLYTAAGYSRKIHEFRCPVIREFRIFRISSPSPLVSSFFWQDTTHGVMVVKHLDDVSKSKSFRFLARFIRDRCILKTFNSGRIVKIRDIFSKRYSKQMFFQRVLSGERRYISCVLREREEIRKTRFDLRCRDGCSEEKKKRKINRARSYVFKVYNFCFMQE